MLSDKARDIYGYIVRYSADHGYSPSIREVGEQFAIASTNGVRHHLNALEQAGYIRRDPKLSRAIVPIESRMAADRGSAAVGATRSARPARRALGIPLLGRVAAGLPATAEELEEELISLETVFPSQDGLFALRVRGMSMRDAGILDGDFVIVRKQDYARDGDQVVALVGHEDATVKIFRRERDAIELHPANPEFEVLRVGPDEEFRILGVVLGLVRPPSRRG